MERLTQLRDQIASAFEGLSWGQRGGIAVAVLATVGALVWIVSSATSVPMRTLFADLEPDQMSRVVQELDARGVRYDLRGDRTVLVPEDQLYQARIHLAGQGVPSSGGAGFELFDDAEFGMTAFTQRVNYQRAMENELSRTIRALDSVRLARVHLVLPEDALFEEDQKDPTASVVLTLDRGLAPDDAEIQSIRYLVSSAVEGLSPDSVTVVDSMGRTLARPSSDGGLGGSVEALEASREIEEDIEERIVGILEPIVGERRVRASVRVELDTSEVVETVEEYDPDTVAVRSEQRSQQTRMRTEGGNGGAAGAVANLPGGAQGVAAGGGGEEESTQTEEQLAYEINSVIRQRVQNGFTVSRMTAAVVIDATGPSSASPTAPTADGAAAPEAPVPSGPAWTAEQIAQLTTLVENVVGFDENRGDRVMVMQETFIPEAPLDLGETPLWASPDVFVPALRYAVLLLGLLLLGLFVVRPVVAALLHKPEPEPETQMIVRTVAELEGEMGPDGAIGVVDDAYEELRKRVLALTDEDADRASEVITEWIRVDAA